MMVVSARQLRQMELAHLRECEEVIVDAEDVGPASCQLDSYQQKVEQLHIS